MGSGEANPRVKKKRERILNVMGNPSPGHKARSDKLLPLVHSWPIESAGGFFQYNLFFFP